MRLKPNLFGQGLLMVAIPIFFQLIFLSVLAGLLQEVEKEVEEENRRKSLVLYCQEIQNQFFHSGLALNEYKWSRDSAHIQRTRQIRRRVQADLQEMSKLINKSSIDEKNVFANFQNASNNGLAALDHHLEVMIVTGSASETGPEMQLGLIRFINAASALQKQVESKSTSKQKEQDRHNFVSALYAGCAVNVLIGLCLVGLFAKSTVTRLRVLMENTQRLSKSKELLKPVGGSDEIAHLDKVFHEMAQSLEEAARHKQELVQMVSHDLKTPLSSVQMSLSSMADGVYGELPTPILKQIQISEFNVTRLIHLIRDLLDIDRLEAGKLDMYFQNVAVYDIINESVSAVQAFAERSKVSLVPVETSTRIDADSDRLVQVLVNLLSNAIKYSPKGGTVTVNAIDKGDSVEIQVIDNGRGIPSQFIDSIFNRFQQVSRSDATQHKGTGLGLAIAKAIVVAHHGEIGVVSREGEGSIFWIRLPVHQQPN